MLAQPLICHEHMAWMYLPYMGPASEHSHKCTKSERRRYWAYDKNAVHYFMPGDDLGPDFRRLLLCYDFKYAMHIVMDAGMRNLCEDFQIHHKKLLITPYAPSLW